MRYAICCVGQSGAKLLLWILVDAEFISRAKTVEEDTGLSWGD